MRRQYVLVERVLALAQSDGHFPVSAKIKWPAISHTMLQSASAHADMLDGQAAGFVDVIVDCV
jgi:hypothetical protein